MGTTAKIVGMLGLGVLTLVALAWAWQAAMRYLEAHRVADWGKPWLNRLDGLNRILCRKFHRLHFEPLALPTQGGAIVAANHISGLDPLLMIAASPRPLRFIIAREQYERFYLRWLFRAIGCIPIGRRGGHRDALASAKAALQRGEIVALFPEGGIRLELGPASLKPGVALMAQETGVPVHVLRVEGVRGRGRTLTAVFLRSRARIALQGTLYCAPRESETFLRELASRLAGVDSALADTSEVSN